MAVADSLSNMWSSNFGDFAFSDPAGIDFMNDPRNVDFEDIHFLRLISMRHRINVT